ncbi:MAG: CHAT domain-containing tetratricopeptide repeat protein [Planctomycetota bacterium]|jgi:tetratricopeptide (TPR) repeat protein
MSSQRFPGALLLLGALVVAQDRPFADDPPLAVDSVVEVELLEEDPFLSSKGRGRWFRLEPTESGPLTIDVESHDLDVFLHVRDETNEKIASDFSSGVEWNAHLVMSVEAGRTYRVGALAGSEDLGVVRVSVRTGEHAVPVDRDLLAARVAFNREAARRARERGDEEGLAQFLLNAANLAFNMDDYEASRPHFDELLELARRTDDALRETAALAFLGAIDVRERRTRQALERLEPALEGARALQHGGLERFVLDNLGDTQEALHRRLEAETSYREMLTSARTAGDTATEVIALRKLGEARSRDGDHEEALALLEESVARAAEDGDADQEADALLSLGHHFESRGEVHSALEAYSMGLQLGPSEKVAMALVGSLGNVHLSAGRYDEARGCYDEVLEWAARSGDRHTHALARQQLGLVAFHLGNMHAALEELDAALELFAPHELQDRAQAHYNRAVCWRVREDTEAERTELETAIALAGEARLETLEALFTGQLGAWHLTRHDPDEARRLLETAQAMLPESTGEAVRGVINANLAAVARETGDPRLANELARKGADLLIGGGKVGAAVETLHSLAQSALDLGDAATVQAVLEEVEPLLARPLLTGLGVDERAGMRSLTAGWSEVEPDLVALLLEQAGEDTEVRARIVAEGFERTGRWKGRALLEGLAEHRSLPTEGEAAAATRERDALLADVGSLTQRLARARQRGEPAVDRAALETASADLLAQVDVLDARLEQIAPREALLAAPRGSSLQEARTALLSHGRILIDYVAGERTLYAYVLTEDALEFVDLGPRDEIEAMCRRHLAGMSDPRALASVADVVNTGSELHRRLLAPLLAAAGEDATGLLIVPTGELAPLPFESLVVEGEGAERFSDVEFVLDRLPVGYGPSTPVLVALAEAEPRRDAGRVVVLGDPIYPVEQPELGRFDLRGVPRAEELGRLPATRDEALAVAEVVMNTSGEADVLDRLEPLREERSATLRTPAIELYLGGEASPERLRGDMSPYSVIHCASHGYADLQDPRRSGLVLAFGEDRAGYVPLAEVLDMRLDADLTVLSACQTAQGHALKGEGVQSVARAFLYAGSRTVVASLWQVSDVETALTMQHFYEGWMTDGKPLPEALRAAKRALREGAPAGTTALRGGLLRAAPRSGSGDLTGHPYYWAPFVHIGRP